MLFVDEYWCLLGSVCWWIMMIAGECCLLMNNGPWWGMCLLRNNGASWRIMVVLIVAKKKKKCSTLISIFHATTAGYSGCSGYLQHLFRKPHFHCLQVFHLFTHIPRFTVIQQSRFNKIFKNPVSNMCWKWRVGFFFFFPILLLISGMHVPPDIMTSPKITSLFSLLF